MGAPGGFTLTPAEFRERWVEALRSGRFKQAIGALAEKFEDDEEWRYCCLGVACELYVELGGALEVVENRDDKSYGGEFSYLPESVRMALNLATRDGALSHRDNRSLADENDAEASFQNIADLIASGGVELINDSATA